MSKLDAALDSKSTAGRRAGYILDAAGPMLEEAVMSGVYELLAWFRTHPWSSDEALKRVAQISAIHQLRETLEHDVEVGRKAEARLLTPTA